MKIVNGNFTWGKEAPKKKEEKKSEEVKRLTISSTNNDMNMSYESKRLTETQIVNPAEDAIRTQLKNINLTIHKGEFVGIIGEVGSGKSSLLQSILNNLTIVEENPEDPTRLIINGSISYTSQIPWIQNATLRKNILFNNDFQEFKYNRILEICELKNDLQSLVGGDMTEIGEKGINLSGGQKARVAIARAVYSDTDIYLFDDPISALDSHVGQNVMKNVIMDALKTKTRILVTHALQYLSYCDRIIIMSGGTIKWEGTYEELKENEFFKEYENKLKKQQSGDLSNIKNEEEKKVEEVLDEEKKTGKDKQNNKKEEKVSRITKEEDKEEGNVKLSVYRKYISYTGGFILFFGVLICKIILI